MARMTAEELLRRYAAGERDFKGADLRDVNLRGATLCGNVFYEESYTDFSGADLSGADLTGTNLKATLLNKTDLSKASLIGANLCRSRLRGAVLTAARLDNADMSGADLFVANLFGAKLIRTFLMGAKLTGANLVSADLSRAHLDDADLSGSNLNAANLESASLERADLSGASLRHTVLHRANLSSARLNGAHLFRTTGVPIRTRCRIDYDTYLRSEWGTNDLLEWHSADVAIDEFERFPEEMRMLILGQREGLCLYFNTRLTPIDRFLIDGVIFGVLGKDTDCQVVEFKQGEGSATVRLQASKREDLERVAEALHRRVWEQQERTQEQALVKAASLLGPREMLTDLRQRVDRVELRLDKEQAWSWDLGKDRLQFARPVRLFLSYAPEDEQLRHQLEGHLATLKRQGVIENWHAGLVRAGAARDAVQQGQLDASDVVLVLVSADLLRSDALFDELQRALARHKAGEARVIPVLARKVDLADTPLVQLQSLPEGGKPVTLWADRDEAWANVASGIRMMVLGMVGPQQQKPALPPG